MTRQPRPLLLTADPKLLDQLLGLAAAAGAAVDVAIELTTCRPQWTDAPLVLLGVDMAAAAAGRLEARAGVLLVTGGSDSPELSNIADAVGAEKVICLQHGEADLVEQPLPALKKGIVEFLQGDANLAKVPVDIRGAVFQRKVWNELLRIPRGETRTYAEIARAIGAPDAVRAVGSACGANPVALVVPCHRAVRTDGGLGGYAWGLPRKKKLLALEKKK